MADLYGAVPFSNTKPEEISTFLNQLLHNSSSSCMQFKAGYIHSFPSQVSVFFTPAANSGSGMAIPVEDRCRVGGSAVQAESEPRVNFSDPGTYFGANALSSAGDFSYDSETDKALMLDEAIEYLKQLQLQVQMLSMKNGLSLYPMCLPGVLQPMQMTPTGMGYDKGNGFFSPNTGVGTFSSNEESSMNTPFNLSNPCTISNQPIVSPSAANASNFETSFGFESSAEAWYGPFSKVKNLGLLKAIYFVM
ncbi:hypothetical protein CRYUN_Cryun35bG0033400 [Craigia yunnanensis]